VVVVVEEDVVQRIGGWGRGGEGRRAPAWVSEGKWEGAIRLTGALVAVRCAGAEVDNDPKTLVTEECRKTVCAEAWANYLEVSAALLHARRRVLRQLTLDRNPVGWPPHTVRTGAAQPRVLRVVPTCAGGARAWGAGVHNNRASLGCSPRLPVAY
jgi:hypothetical protein